MINHRFAPLLIAALATLALAAPPKEEDLNRIREAAPAQAPAKPAKARKMLVFNHPAGFRHSSIETGTEAMKILGDKSKAFTIDVSGDPAVFTADNLKQYDAICFMNTTGPFFTSDPQAQAVYDFVKAGHGLVGIHSASDANYDRDDYGLLIGGWFDGHPWHEKVTIKIDDPASPLTKSFLPGPLLITDEIYQFRVWPYSRKRLHVLLSLDNSRPEMTKKGKRGPAGDYAVSWVHKFGEGRVFYCSLGHREEIYWNPAVMAHYLAGIQYALGDLKVDDAPSETGEPEPKPHAQLIEKLRSGAPEAVAEMESLLNKAKGNRDEAVKLEYAMLAALGDAKTPMPSKQAIAKDLWMVGSDSTVIALGGLIGDENLSHMARYSLERIDHPYVPFFLTGALDNPNLKPKFKVGVIDTLAARKEQAAVPKLAGLVGSKDPALREAAINALGKIGGEPAAKALGDARAKASEDVRPLLDDAYLSVADGLAEAGRKPQAALIYKELFAPSEPEQIRVGALRGLVGLSDNGTRLLVEQLSGQDASMRVVAARMLQESTDPKATEAIVAKVEGASPKEQAVLVEVLAARGDKSAGPVVAKAAESKDPAAKTAALRALGKLGDGSSVPILAAAAAAGKGEMRDAARHSLATLRGQDVNAKILAAIETADTNTSVELVRGLGERQADETVPRLLKIVASPKTDPKVRRETYRVLGDITPSEKLPDLLMVILNEADAGSLPVAEKAALDTANRIDDQARRAGPVLAAHAQSTGEGRALLLRLLGNIGGAEALKVVRVDVESPDTTTRDAAVRALASWPDAAAQDDLLKIAKGAQDRNTKIIALRGYIRLAGLPSKRKPAETVAMYKQALELADRPDEKRLALAGLAGVPSAESAQLVQGLSGDPQLKSEADQALSKIRQSLAEPEK